MLKIPYEEILYKIEAKTGKSKPDIQKQIDAKLKQLTGLISKEGAAHIVANELGVKVFEQTTSKLQIKSIVAGMRSVEVDAKIIRKYEARDFDTGKRKGRVGSVLLSDGTGASRLVFWNDLVDKMNGLNEGDIVRVHGAYVRERNGFKEIHLNDKSKLTINPPGVSIELTPRSQGTRFAIEDLNEEAKEAEIFGFIVQVFEPRFFEVCPKCGKRTKGDADGYNCKDHGKITPDFSAVMNVIVDDGTETIRIACFKRQALRLLSIGEKELEQVRTGEKSFNEYKMKLLGVPFKCTGRVVKNPVSERIEMVSQLVYYDPDPQPELTKLEVMLKGLNESKATPTEEVSNEEPVVEPEEISDNVEVVDD